MVSVVLFAIGFATLKNPTVSVEGIILALAVGASSLTLLAMVARQVVIVGFTVAHSFASKARDSNPSQET